MKAMVRLSALGTAAAALAALAMMLHVVADVFAKYFFDHSIDGTEETVSYYYMLAVVLLPLANVEIKNEQISVDVLYDRLGPALRMFCDVVARALTCVLFSALGYQSLQQAIYAYGTGEMAMGAANIVIWPARFILPIGYFLGAAVVLARMISVRRSQYPAIASTAERG